MDYEERRRGSGAQQQLSYVTGRGSIMFVDEDGRMSSSFSNPLMMDRASLRRHVRLTEEDEELEDDEEEDEGEELRHPGRKRRKHYVPGNKGRDNKKKDSTTRRSYRAHSSSAPLSPSAAANKKNGILSTITCGPNLTARRCFFICCPITFLLILLFVLMFIFLGGKSFAQGVVNSSGVELEELNILQVFEDPDNDDMQIRISGRIDNRSPFEALLQAVRVVFSHEGAKFGEFIFPSTKLQRGAYTYFDFTTWLTVLDREKFFEWTAKLMNEDVLDVTLGGTISLKTLGLRFGSISLKKPIEVKGVRGFMSPMMQFTQATVQRGQKDRLGVSMRAIFHNPSTVAFTYLGRLNFSVFYDDALIGTVSTLPGHNVSLQRGSNELDMTLSLLKAPDDSNVPAMAEFIGLSASGKTLNITLAGNDNSTDYPLIIGQLKSIRATVPITILDMAEVNLSPVLPVDPLTKAIPTEAAFYYLYNHNVTQQRNYLLQAAFQTLSLQNLISQRAEECRGGKGGPYIDVISLNWNMFNTQFNLLALNLSIYFPGDNSISPPIERFLLSQTHPIYSGRTVISTFGVPIQAQTKSLFSARMCLEASAKTLIDWFDRFVCKRYGDQNGKPFVFGTELLIDGEIKVRIGDFQVDKIPFSQYIWVISHVVSPTCTNGTLVSRSIPDLV